MKNLEELNRLVGHSVTVAPTYACRVTGTLKKHGPVYSVATSDGNANVRFRGYLVASIRIDLNRIYLV